MKKTRYETGVIHGRFQVLHNDHVRYIMAGKALCDHLVIGITNPDPGLTRYEKVDPERSSDFANPLTYYERYLCVKQWMRKHLAEEDAISIVPFPINLPDFYKYYLPLDSVFFVTVYDNWGKEKLAKFKSQGLNTHVLWEVPPEEKGISAGWIRQCMIEDKPWEHLVPDCIVKLMNQWRIADRLKKIAKEV